MGQRESQPHALISLLPSSFFFTFLKLINLMVATSRNLVTEVIPGIGPDAGNCWSWLPHRNY